MSKPNVFLSGFTMIATISIITARIGTRAKIASTLILFSFFRLR